MSLLMRTKSNLCSARSPVFLQNYTLPIVHASPALYIINIFLQNLFWYLIFGIYCVIIHLTDEKIQLEVNILPNIKSAKKRVKVIAAKTLKNQMIKSNLKTCIKNFDAFVQKGDKANSVEACKLAFKKIDQAVAKGILHKNAAARKKAQLSIKLNKIGA